jgi:hypothetical protein
MRNRTVCAVTTLLLLSGLCLGQRAPVPAITNPLDAEVSLNYMLVVKNQNPDLGNGVDFTATRYFARHIGVTAESEAMYVSYSQLREYAARLGPVYHLNQGGNIQPFVHALVGYSVVSSTALGPTRPHKYGGSLLLGGGIDVRLRGPVFARTSMDVVDGWSTGTRFGRGTVGLAIKFGDGQR